MKSPLATLFGNSTQMEYLGNYETVAVVSSIEQEYDAVRNHVGIFDFSALGKIKVSGKCAMEYLQLLVTRDIEYLAPEKSAVTLMLDDAGQVVGMVTVLNFEEYYLVETWPTAHEKVLDWMRKQSSEDVVIEDVSTQYAIIGVEGPQSWELTQKLVDFEITSLPYQGFFETEWEGNDIVVARIGYTAEYGYQFMIREEQAPKLLEVLLQEGVPFEAQLCGWKVLDPCMLEVRQPNIDLELDQRNLFEAALNWLVDFRKDEFVGRDAVLNMKEQGFQRSMVGFSAPQDVNVREGDAIKVEDDVVGQVVCAVNSGVLGKKLGLAMLDNKYAVSGLELAVDAGGLSAINTISSPYILPKSWSIKMI
jgi:glycine cleavage system aminomethyltransferase T